MAAHFRLWIACVAISTTGCVAGRPSLFHPGDIQHQRFNAVTHDPYTDNDAGPEVVGGRPRDYQKPLAEPVRNRWLMDSWWGQRTQ